MTICSLLPSATEIVCAVGLIDELVAISHECDFPPEVRSKPVITSSRLGDDPRTSAEIDALVSAQLHQHTGLYALDEDLLARLKPDVILTQELCEVCAVSYDQVTEAVRKLSGDQVVLSLEPASIPGILATIQAVGGATGREDRARELVSEMKSQIEALAQRARTAGKQQRVACLEWIDPPFSAGHWVPEMVQIAGGHDGLATPGDESRRLDWEQVMASRPEVVILMPCGFDVNRAAADYKAAGLPSNWSEVDAVRAGQVFAVDANAYFSRPGPRVVRGIEIVQEILEACRTGAEGGEGWGRVTR
jgi:iron complex transport system substrate-binding protein